MISIKVDGLDAALSAVNAQARQVKFAAAVALTRTANKIRAELPAELERKLDRPTNFTKQGLYLKAARKDDLTAEVGFKDRQASYMRLQIAGGLRSPGPRGIKLPGNIVLNAFGNIPRGVIAQLKAAAKSGDLSGAVARRVQPGRNRRKGAAPVELWLGKPTGKGWENAPMGIWRRVPGNPGKLIPVIVFGNKAARYKSRIDLQRFAGPIVSREWPAQFSAALGNAIATAR